MNISEVKELIKAVSDSELTAFDYTEGNINISLRKCGAEPIAVKENTVTVVTESNNSVASNTNEASDDKQSEQPVEARGNVVKSPLVGTAYMAPEEGAKPFVQVGDLVKKGQTLAIVEAMKLMNEIESDFDGEVKEILVENGQTIEYGQEMFIIG